MKKVIIIIIVILVLVVAWFLLRPVFVDDRVEEDFPETSSSNNDTDSKDINNNNDVENPPAQELRRGEAEIKTISQGQFVGLAGHEGEGTVKLVEAGDKKYVRFEEDFSVDNAPDMFVHLGKDDQYDKEVNLGKVKGNIGSQNYEIPADVNVEEFNEVWVWCRAFSVPMGKAELEI